MLILLVIFILLLGLIGGERGVLSLISLCLNVLVLTGLMYLISWSFDPLLITLLASFLISNITLFYQNGKNAKILSSFISMIFVVLILSGITYFITYKAKLGGLNDMIAANAKSFGISPDVGVNMFRICISMMITGMVGAALDTSITISSAVYEVYRNNRHYDRIRLFTSGIHMGKDILGTTMNTLSFAFLGESMSLFLMYQNYNYTFLSIINSKAFLQESIYILISALSCVMIIPITAWITSYILLHSEKFSRALAEDDLFQLETDPLKKDP